MKSITSDSAKSYDFIAAVIVAVESSDDKSPILDKIIESCAKASDSSMVLPCFCHSILDVATSVAVAFN